MMVKLKSESLNFLEIFNLIKSDSWDEVSNKVRIKSKGHILYFYLINNNIIVRSQVDIIEKDSEDFHIFVEIKNLFSILKTLPENSIITFENNKIIINDNESYTLETLQADEFNTDFLFDNDNIISEFELTNPSKLFKAKNFTGDEQSKINVVGFYRNKFYASDTKLGCILNTKGKSDYPMYISSKLISIFSLYRKSDDKKFTIYKKENSNGGYFSYRFDNVDLVIMQPNSKLPDLTSGQFADMCNMKTEAVVNLADLSEVLLRMKVVSRKNPLNKIFIKFNRDSLTIENRWKNNSTATIKIENILTTHGHEVAVSCDSLIKIIRFLDGEKAYFYYDPDSIVLTILDETKNNMFFHVALVKD